MKKIIVIITISILASTALHAQNINWRSLETDQHHSAYFNFGFQYGMTAQLGYGYKAGNSRPVLLSIDYSFPMGNNLFDDHKVRLGGQIEALRWNNFSLTAKVMMVYRRYANEMVRIVNFGSEFSAIAGYYKPKWHVAGEFGFDKAVASHLSHRNAMRDIYPDITDGWYLPSGGNYFYGVQAGVTVIKDIDLTMRAGLTNAQKQDEDASLPYYLQLGLIKHF